MWKNVEEYKITEPRIWSYTEKTNGVEFNKNQITCSTSNKNEYGGNTTTTAEIGSHQFTTSH